MRAQIISIGSELILGHLTDTNATHLAQELAGLGIELTLVTQVGDDLARLASAIERATSDAEVVICTGGVGPTADDLTREAIAQVMGEEPRVDGGLLETVRGFFQARGIDMPERNSKQAWLIPSAEAIPNPIGTAPGWFVRRNGRVIAAMPGVPREMFRMWREQVVPHLSAMQPGRSVRSTTIKTIGIGESAAEHILHDLVALDYPVVATYAKDDGVHIRVTSTAATAEQAERDRDIAVAEVRRRLGDYVYGIDGTTLPQAIAETLRFAGMTISVLDAGGGGRFASLIGSDPASADRLVSATMTPASKTSSIGELTKQASAAAGDGEVIVAIAVNIDPTAENVYEGTIAVALGGAIECEEIMPMRSGFEDIQRRSALFAADLLRRALAAQT